MRYLKNNFRSLPIYSTSRLPTYSRINLSILLNFFKEAFLFDYFYKVSFIKFIENYILRQGILFNLTYLNNQQTFYIYSVISTLNKGLTDKNGLLSFFKLFIRLIFAVISVSILVTLY